MKPTGLGKEPNISKTIALPWANYHKPRGADHLFENAIHISLNIFPTEMPFDILQNYIQPVLGRAECLLEEKKM